MNRFNSLIAVSSLALAAGSLMTPDTAHAVTQPRIFFTNAADHCQSALPVFDVQIRKRPLAVQNEGSNSAFVTCAFNGQRDGLSEESGVIQIDVAFNSTSGVQELLTCTFVAGKNDMSGNALYISKSVVLAGNGTQNSIQLRSTDFGLPTNFPAGPYGMSCNLRPNMGVNNIDVTVLEDVGDS